MLFKLWSKISHSMPFGIIRILVNFRQRKLQHMMIYSTGGTHENSLNWTNTNLCLILHRLLLSLNLIGMRRNQGRWVTSRVKLSTVFNNICVLIMCVCVSSLSYFGALSKGECLPVKDRLEVNVATQRTDTGLTPGLLKILHKQVFYLQQDPRNHLFHIVAVGRKAVYFIFCIYCALLFWICMSCIFYIL